MKAIIIIIVLFWSNTFYCQVPVVSVPILENLAIQEAANNAKTSAEILVQSNILFNSLKISKDALKEIMEISDMIISSFQVIYIIDNITIINANILKLIILIESGELQGDSLRTTLAYLKTLNKLIFQVKRLETDISNIIATGSIKMKASERLTQLYIIERKTEKLKGYTNRIRSYLVYTAQVKKSYYKSKLSNTSELQNKLDSINNTNN